MATKNIGGTPIVLSQDGEEKMFRLDGGVQQTSGFAPGQAKNAFCFSREGKDFL